MKRNIKYYLVFSTLLGVFISLSVEDSFAQVVYKVKQNETFSTIIKNYYPGYGTLEKRIYGPSGKMTELLKLNPTLTPNSILRQGQEIILPKNGLVLSKKSETKVIEKVTLPEKKIEILTGDNSEKAPIKDSSEKKEEVVSENVEGIEYTVQDGDDFFKIIKKYYPGYGTTKGKRIGGPGGKFSEVVKLNPILKTNPVLTKGQKVYLPVSGYVDPGIEDLSDVNNETEKVVTQKVETAPEEVIKTTPQEEVKKETKLTVQETSPNPVPSPNEPKVVIEQTSSENVQGIAYIIQDGDDFFKIIKKYYPGYGTTKGKRIGGPGGKFSEVVNLNPILKTNPVLYKGQKVFLPIKDFVDPENKLVAENIKNVSHVPEAEVKSEQNESSKEKNNFEKEEAEKERLKQEAIAKEEAEKERVRKEALAKEEAEKERVRKEALAKEEADKERLKQEAIAKAEAEKERVRKEALAREEAEKERLRIEALAKDEVKKETQPFTYCVKKGETFSTIIKNYYPGYGSYEKRIYGPNGKMTEILKLNPTLNEKTVLALNQKILLPPEGLILEEDCLVKLAAETERLKQEALAKLAAEKVKIKQEAIAKETAEKEKLKQEAIAKETVENEKIRQEAIAKETAEKEKLKQEAIAKEMAEKEKLNKEISVNNTQEDHEEWRLTPYAGIKYTSVDQTGSLGGANISGTFPFVKFASVFLVDDHKIGLEGGAFLFDYDSRSGPISERFYSTRLYSIMNNMIVGVFFEQIPLFRNNAGQLEIIQQSTYLLHVGYGKEKKLRSKKKNSFFRWDAGVSLPFYASSNSDQVRINSISGFGIHGKIELRRLLWQVDDMKFHLSWINLLDYFSSSMDAKWDVSKGPVKSGVGEVSSLLGLTADF